MASEGVIVLVVGGCVYADLRADAVRRANCRHGELAPARRTVRVPSGLELWQFLRVAGVRRAIVARAPFAWRESRFQARGNARRMGGAGGLGGLCECQPALHKFSSIFQKVKFYVLL